MILIRELLEKRAKEDGEAPFVYFNDQILTFATLELNVNKAANILKNLGIAKGDHVCLFLPNCIEFFYVWFGLAKIGGVMVPINQNLRGDGLKYIINHSDSKLIFVHSKLFEPFSFIRKDLEYIDKAVVVGQTKFANPDTLDFNDIMSKVSSKTPLPLEILPSDPLSIIYTSGTTGPPKGAIISHFNYVNTGKAWAEEAIGYEPDDIFFTSLPLFHANAQMFTTMGTLYSGRPFVLQEKFSASNYLDQIRKHKATVFNYIGGMLTILMKQPVRDNDAKNELRVAFGAAAPKDIWLDIENRFGFTIIEGYGLTESGGVALCNPPKHIKLGSIGKPLSFCDVDVFDENDQHIPVGKTGEIVIREKVPNSMFLGYYKQPDKTSEAWRNGWFHTGDRGYKDHEDYFFFVDRSKDCIRRRGENISSFDIEKIVNSHPAILESATVAVPSELGEDDVKVFVVLREHQQLKPEDLLTYCEERMAYFMVPRYVQFIKELPKTATERIEKYKLREMGVGNAWDREMTGYKLKRV